MSKSYTQKELDRIQRRKERADRREELRDEIYEEMKGKNKGLSGFEMLTLMGMELGRRMEEEREK